MHAKPVKNSNQAELIQQNDSDWSLVGKITFRTAKDLYMCSQKLFKKGKNITIDFSQVEHVDSAAMALLVEWTHDAKKIRFSLQFKQVPKGLLNLLTLSHVKDVLPII